MPVHLKAIISCMVAIVATLAWYFEGQARPGHVQWMMLALGGFMVFALWLFPEAKGKKGKGE